MNVLPADEKCDEFSSRNVDNEKREVALPFFSHS